MKKVLRRKSATYGDASRVFSLAVGLYRVS